MDGTLIDSTQTWIDADIEFGRQNGFDYTEEMFLTTKTLKFMKACEYMSQFCDLSAEETAKRYYEILESKYADCPLTAGAMDFLNLCKDNGIKMCILTAGIKPLAEKVLNSHNIAGYFDFLATADSIDYDKTNPEAFRVCAEKLGANIKETIMFEDSSHAAVAAKAAGAVVIGLINPGNAFEHDTLKSVCDRVVTDFTELVPAVSIR
jgi:sugar-phosphatase